MLETWLFFQSTVKHVCANIEQNEHTKTKLVLLNMGQLAS